MKFNFSSFSKSYDKERIPRKKIGFIIDYLEKDGFENPTLVFNVLEGGSLTSMAKTTGIGILEISTVFDNIKPDIVVTIAVPSRQLISVKLEAILL